MLNDENYKKKIQKNNIYYCHIIIKIEKQNKYIYVHKVRKMGSLKCVHTIYGMACTHTHTVKTKLK